MRGGYITISVIVFAAVFGLLIAGLLGFIFTQHKVQITKEAREKALQIAEAGLDYYKWFLAHYPEDLQNGTGEEGPYEVAYSDPEEGEIGKFELDIGSNLNCGDITSINISSVGWTNDKPNVRRELYGKYSRPSVAEYAFIIGDNVWAGADRDIKGRYHSNGGIRMDGTNQSTVTSAVETWQCTSSFGCSPTQTVSGVFGSGSGSELWDFPVAQIDFGSITADLVAMKSKAQESGIYFGPTGGQSNKHGYHAIFQSDGTVDIYKVKNTSYAYSIHIDDLGGDWHKDYHTITSETFEGSFNIPVDCSLIFIEDKLWIEGTVKGKVTIAAAKVQQSNFNSDVILEGDIDYTTTDGSDGLTVLAENSILIPVQSPYDLSLKGIFIAQNGYFGRNLYPCWYSPYDHRGTLTMNGTIVSSERVGTKWGYSGASCGSNQWSGYNERNTSYDRKLATDPPPLTPYISSDFKFVEWREEQ